MDVKERETTVERSRTRSFRKWLQAPPQFIAPSTSVAYASAVHTLLRARGWLEAQVVVRLRHRPASFTNTAASAWRQYRAYCEWLGEPPLPDYFTLHRAAPPRFVKHATLDAWWDCALNRPFAGAGSPEES